MTVGSGSAGGGQHEFAGRSRLEPSAPASRRAWPRAEYGVVVHSHTLPIMSKSPKAFGAKVPTGDVPTQPRAPSLRYGNRPCQVLAIRLPSTVGSSPHAYTVVAPAAAAYSHSASVGSRRFAQAAYAPASG